MIYLHFPWQCSRNCCALSLDDWPASSPRDRSNFLRLVDRYHVTLHCLTKKRGTFSLKSCLDFRCFFGRTLHFPMFHPDDSSILVFKHVASRSGRCIVRTIFLVFVLFVPLSSFRLRPFRVHFCHFYLFSRRTLSSAPRGDNVSSDRILSSIRRPCRLRSVRWRLRSTWDRSVARLVPRISGGRRRQRRSDTAWADWSRRPSDHPSGWRIGLSDGQMVAWTTNIPH